MRWHLPFCCLPLAIALLALAGCATRSPEPIPAEAIPPVAPDTWREIREQIWTASDLAQSEARIYARETLQEWMMRVRDKTETEFIPWYTGYWTQQWIGLKAGWYEMNKAEDEPPVEDHLVDYIRERYYELVLEPAGRPTDPQTITEQTAGLYVRLLSEQLQRIPKMHAIAPRSLQQRLEKIPLIAVSGTPPQSTPLSTILEHNSLAGDPAYEALLARADPVPDSEKASAGEEPLQLVAEDTVARLVARLPVHAGGNAAGLVVGQALGLFISTGVAAWSAISHEQEKPEIESGLRQALDAGLDEMWERLMKDPELGVLYPIDHIHRQIEMGLFPANQRVPVTVF